MSSRKRLIGRSLSIDIPDGHPSSIYLERHDAVLAQFSPNDCLLPTWARTASRSAKLRASEFAADTNDGAAQYLAGD
jgi:hypothetical protein